MSLLDPMMIAQVLASVLVAPKAPPAGKSVTVIALYGFAGLMTLMAAVFLLLALNAWAVTIFTTAQAFALTAAVALGLASIGGIVGDHIRKKHQREARSHLEDTGKALLAMLDNATQGLEEPIADHPRSSVLLASLAGYVTGNKLH